MAGRVMAVRRAWFHWLWLAGSSILVVAGVGAFFLLGNDEEPQAEEASNGVVEEQNYYVLLTLIEVTPKTTDGLGRRSRRRLVSRSEANRDRCAVPSVECGRPESALVDR